MSATRIFLIGVPRCRHIMSQVSACLILGAVSVASIAYYLYACLSLAQLQQISPDQLAKAVLGA